MRISVVERDTGFSPNARQAKVTLDGIEVKDCITADEEGGFVRIRSDNQPGGEVRRGKVEIVTAATSTKSSPFRKPFERFIEK